VPVPAERATIQDAIKTRIVKEPNRRVLDWAPSDVALWLEGDVALPELQDAFTKNNVTGRDLIFMTPEKIKALALSAPQTAKVNAGIAELRDDVRYGLDDNEKLGNYVEFRKLSTISRAKRAQRVKAGRDARGAKGEGSPKGEQAPRQQRPKGEQAARQPKGPRADKPAQPKREPRPQRPKEDRANFFVGIRVTNQNVVAGLQGVQTKVADAVKPLGFNMILPLVNPKAFHISLAVLHIDNDKDQLAAARKVLAEFKQNIRSLYGKAGPKLRLKGVSLFGEERVAFANVDEKASAAELEKLKQLSAALHEKFTAAGIKVFVGEEASFIPHVTIIKMKKAGGQHRANEHRVFLKKVGAGKLTEIVAPFNDQDFGEQVFESLDLMCMADLTEPDTFYPIYSSVHFGDKMDTPDPYANVEWMANKKRINKERADKRRKEAEERKAAKAAEPSGKTEVAAS